MRVGLMVERILKIQCLTNSAYAIPVTRGEAQSIWHNCALPTARNRGLQLLLQVLDQHAG